MVKESISTCMLLGVVAIAAAADPALRPASNPASTAPSTQSMAAKLPERFAIFRTVNPFSLKRNPTSAGTVVEKGGPEASIILNGVAQTGNGSGDGTDSGRSRAWTAFFDSGKGNPVLMLSVGDPIARGHIQSADLDSITYVCGERSQHVEVGQNLNGETPAPTSQPTAPDATPDKEHKPGRPPKRPPTGEPPNGRPENVPPDGQPQNPQPPNQDN